MNSKEKNYYKIFAMDGEKILHDEADIGIINGMLSTNGPYRNVLRVKGLFAPPFVSSDFNLEIRLFDEKVKANKYTWYPVEMERHGSLNGVNVDSSLVLAAGKRAMTLHAVLTNTTEKTLEIPLQIDVNATLDYEKNWNFARPKSISGVGFQLHKNGLMLSNNFGSIVVDTDIPGLIFKDYCKMLTGAVQLAPHAKISFNIVTSIGYNKFTSVEANKPRWSNLGYSVISKSSAEQDADELIANPTQSIEEGRLHFVGRVADLLDKMPQFSASDERLNKWYYRSLVHLLLNQWNDVPEFVLNPYFSTGSLNGGCCCSYMWDFGANWKIWGMYNPEATKQHIKAFLNIDLKNHYAFLPLNNAATGPWYYINQEKIIFCIYYYVLHTGDVAFLNEMHNGRPIIEHVIEQTLVGDDLDKDAVLVDYGAGNHHLELRTKYRYDNVLPDMNLRRCSYYHAADQLCRLIEYVPPVDFIKRADGIRELVRRELYDPDAGWFRWRDAEGNCNLRYTIQMFKTLGFPSGWTLDTDQHKALLSHINTTEFLGNYGMHSMSKLDPAYDQDDIDNGGGGACIFFAPEIMEKLYLNGEHELAESILKRLLWWGERMPFWGDSVVANYIDYRKDTPLQNAIGGAAIAQSIIFGIFGVQVHPSGEIDINPVPPSFSPEISLKGLKIAGHQFDIEVNGKQYTVTCDGVSNHGETGNPMQYNLSNY